MSSRLDQEREARLQPRRMEYALAALKAKGYEVEAYGATTVRFMFKGEQITFYPYSGWHAGKGIKDGRGLDNLLKQI